MWLLNTATRQLEFFQDDRDLRYAILSHRWQDEEVLYQDVVQGRAEAKTGHQKLEATCERAAQDGHQYVWIDTCCIDRTSSTELSEALNSMFRWYQKAIVCYAYLFDVDSLETDPELNSFAGSQWWTRGWTLQELVAPGEIQFFSRDWKLLGTRHSLKEQVHAASGVPLDLLQGIRDLDDYSVAQRMSWAAHRAVTRVEDRAYCLIGLFGVNMPMLYGEGERSFIRLQEEIMRESADHSLFAWKLTDRNSYYGLLAPSPAAFAGCGNICETEDIWMDQTSHQMTNRGIALTARAIPYLMNTYNLALDCEERSADGSSTRIGIFVGWPRHRVSARDVGRRMVEGEDRLTVASAHQGVHSISREWRIPKHPFARERPDHMLHGFVIRNFTLAISEWENSSRLRTIGLDNGLRVGARPDTWDPERGILTMPTGTLGVAVALVARSSGSGRGNNEALVVLAKIGFDDDFCPRVWLPNTRKLSRPMVEDDYVSKEPYTQGFVNDTGELSAQRQFKTVQAVLADKWTSTVHQGSGHMLKPPNGKVHLGTREDIYESSLQVQVENVDGVGKAWVIDMIPKPGD